FATNIDSDFDDHTTTAAGTDAGTDGGWTTDPGDTTLSVTSTGKPFYTNTNTKRRDPVRSTAKLHKAYQSRVGALVAIIQRCLAEGDIALARRAFGLLVRADVNGRKVDLRFGGFWELGAEVLMRSGEDMENQFQLGAGSQFGLEDDGEGVEGVEGEEDSKERRERKRLLRAAKNREQVRAYYETLIHLHPWSRLHPNKMGALDFYPALFGFEMEACFAEHKYGVEELELDRQRPLSSLDLIDDDDGDLPMENDRFGGRDRDDEMEIDDHFTHGHGQQSALDPLRSSPPSPSGYHRGNRGMDNVHPLYQSEMEEDDRRSRRSEVRLRSEKEKLRLKALEQMRDVARRMDAVMENTPYNKDVEMLRLRAMVALYVGDLSVPVSAAEEADTQEEEGGGGRWKSSHEERIDEEEGRRAQAAERERARGLFVKMREMKGGELEEGDEWILELISGVGGGDGEDEDVVADGEEDEGNRA
ncbi:hypothetical protein N0V85_009610, partial [Neurospora sp. IMI 360204]